MTYLSIVFATVWFSFVLTCPPTPPPGGGGGGAGGGGSGGSGGGQSNNTGKREVDDIEVTVVSNQKFDPAMNDSHMQVFKSLLNDYIKAKGASYNKDMVHEEIVDVDGNFAILYTLQGYDCDGVNNFLHEAKSSANFIKDIKIKCGGRPQFVVA
ncbi:unnamed protein product [Cylicocyclus nassatus]|uniref:Uncharacterized protein n=1 Tax=Cylicocyclus nassatus TaxID=53992 RepID=A0AA36GTA9_CYLNA|nr:unnamed protein product [Cylicocyclus nassatus]